MSDPTPVEPLHEEILLAATADLEDAIERRRRHRQLLAEALRAVQEALMAGLPVAARVALEIAADAVGRGQASLD